MDQEPLVTPQPATSPIGRRRFWILLLLGALVAGGGFSWLAATEEGCRALLPWVAELVAGPQRLELRLGAIRGTLLKGIEIASVTGSLPASRLSFSASNVAIKVVAHRLLTGRLRISEITCGVVRVVGPPPAAWIEALPPLPPTPSFGCFLIPGTKIEIDRIRLDRLEWAPSPEGLRVVLSGFDLGSPGLFEGKRRDGHDTAETDSRKALPLHPFHGEAVGTWFGREIFRAGLTGSCSNQLPNLFLEGAIGGNLLGVPLQNEIRARIGRDGIKLDGFLETTTVDLASVSRLFEPFWVHAWPLLRATGTATLSGSWLFDPRLGFQGNLRGGIDRVGVLLAGLNLPVLELTAEVVIRQDEITVIDRGSHFCGMPATLQGTLGWSPGLPPGGNLVLEVPDFRPGEFIGSFPWLVRKGMGWPDFTGSATLKLQMAGRPVSILGNLMTEGLLIGKNDLTASLAGRLTFRQDAGKGPEWRSTFHWLCDDGVPGIVDRFEAHIPAGLKKPSAPVALEISALGTHPSSLEIEGRLEWKGAEFPVEGRLVEGRLTRIASSPDHFFGDGAFLSDLALLSGW